MKETLPVICDKCRVEGMAGDDPFAGIPDILDFDPVPRRRHANGWSPEYQRAFIAALAMTGSERRAARAIGKHAFGAEQLRRARGGKSFAAAWDAALDIYRDRELARLRDNLGHLAKEQSDLAWPLVGGDGDDDDDVSAERREVNDAQRRIRNRLLTARRLMLAAICNDPERREAWEVLVGPVDWDKAARFEAQDDESYARPDKGEAGIPPMRGPDMLITAEVGLLPELTGGYDALAEIQQELEAYEAERSAEERSPETKEPNA